MSIVLVLAGHDPGGGAGIQADMEALASTGCRAATAITALTVQDTRRVHHFVATAPDLLTAQADAVLNDLPVAAIKIGMIGSVDNVLAIAALLQRWPRLPVVLDPVLAGGGGGSLSRGDMAAAIRGHLLPHVTLLTPNSPEALLLCPEAGNNLDRCGAILSAEGEHLHVLITGGHESGERIVNTLWRHGERIDHAEWQRLPGEFHGTGCTLASACTGFIAQGRSMKDATRLAQAYVWQTLKHATRPGHGQALPQRYYWWRDVDACRSLDHNEPRQQ